jgi:hypothetical protein
MLTATYSLVAISAEQKQARSVLSKLRQSLRNRTGDLRAIGEELIGFDAWFQLRKIQAYVIPSLCSASREADRLLARLDAMSARAAAILKSLQEQLQAGAMNGDLNRDEQLAAMTLYCVSLSARLATEEQELYPLAQRALPPDDWFAIASRFFSEQCTNRNHLRCVEEPVVARPADTWIRPGP